MNTVRVLLGLLALSACSVDDIPRRIYIGPPGTVETHAVVAIGRGTAVGDVFRFRVTATLGDETRTRLFPTIPSQVPIEFPHSVAVAAPGRSGVMHVLVEALGSEEQPLAHAAGELELVSQRAVSLSLDLWRCGDAARNPDESCDDGNTNPADVCDGCRTVRWSREVVVPGSVEGRDAVTASVDPYAVAVDARRLLLIADWAGNRVRRLDGDGRTLVTIAGTGAWGLSGDDGPATLARLGSVSGLTADQGGRAYFLDWDHHVVRRINIDGTVTTVAGSGEAGFGGDGELATLAKLSSPRGLSVDQAGRLYIADNGNHRIRMVDLDGRIVTVAGDGTAGFSGDGAPATLARMSGPTHAVPDQMGGILIADPENQRIRRVGPDGIITTVAGTGAAGFSGDNGPATLAQLNYPFALAVDDDGAILIADYDNRRVRRVDANGIISTVAGTGEAGIAADGSVATAAPLSGPCSVAFASGGGFFIADATNHRVMRVDPQGHISTIAGTGQTYFPVDGRRATSVPLAMPWGIAEAQDGALVVSDMRNSLIYRIDPGGAVQVLAGDGNGGYLGDYGPATLAQMNEPRGLALDSAGAIYVADTNNHAVRRIDPDGTITTLAGTGVSGFTADGTQADRAQLSWPIGIAVDAEDRVYIAEYGNDRVRRVDADGRIRTLAGNGVTGYSGDGAAAVAATLNGPVGVAVDAEGRVLIVDEYNHVIRRVSADGIITTVAGTGAQGFFGDGGRATQAELSYPTGIFVEAGGSFLIADSGNLRIRRVDGSGSVSTILGDEYLGPWGDNGPASLASLGYPRSVMVDVQGRLLTTDDTLVRRVELDGIIATVAGLLCPPGDGPLEYTTLWNPRSLLRVGGVTLAAGGFGRVVRIGPANVDVVVGSVGYVPLDDRVLAARTPQLSSPLALAYDQDARILYISQQPVVALMQPALRAVRVDVDDNGEIDDAPSWTMVDVPLPPEAGLIAPGGIAFDARTRTLLVADEGAHCVKRLDLNAGTAVTVVGLCTFPGALAGYLQSPSHVAVGPSGAVYVSDAGNNRVLRVDGDGAVSVVIGDGSASNAGEGYPAAEFPVDRPGQLTLDSLGNLYVAARTAVRLIARAEASTDADGRGFVTTIYRGGMDATAFPEDASQCLSALALEDDGHVVVADACHGFMLRLSRGGE